MHDHNDKNNSSMWWMILLCTLPLIILLLVGGNLFSRGRYLWLILIGGFVVARFWIMLRNHRPHNNDRAIADDKSKDTEGNANGEKHDEHKNQKSHEGCCH
ncbi:MAG: hypothetical protein Q8R26_02675 [bacterium]|nr:hypothetical protein [bacterium]